ncbi:hypothetical protein [Streptomyces sp. HC307]|uniref:hypothetical protein n=1 Tax=Streptomyces flavusporus TaxID=3385496 RepID=UPI0039173433
MGGLRELAAPFVLPGPSGVAVRARLKHLTAEDEKVLRLVGDLLGSLASRDLKARCAAGLDHGAEQWAERKRTLTPQAPLPRNTLSVYASPPSVRTTWVTGASVREPHVVGRRPPGSYAPVSTSASAAPPKLDPESVDMPGAFRDFLTLLGER